MSPALHARLFAKVRAEASDATARAKRHRLSLEQALGVNDVEQKNLRRLRTREQITEAEFVADRKDLETERLRLQNDLSRLSDEDRFEPERYFVTFSVHALSWWDSGDPGAQRMILETAGLNPTLAAGELKIDAAFPFRRWKNPADFSELCSVLNVIRTHPERAAFGTLIQHVRQLLEKFGDASALEATSPSF